MNVLTNLTPADPNHIGHNNLAENVELGAPGRGDGGPAAKGIVVSYGFWIFLLSDIVMFSAFFAAFAVLSGTSTTQAPRYDLSNVAIETGCLLFSSFLCGMAALCAFQRNRLGTQLFLLLTGALGAAFLVLEIREFMGMVANHQGPSFGAYYSAFFALVGCHGLHVSIGLLWLATMMAQIYARGFNPEVRRRLVCFSLFWHALDIVWIGIFSFVYLLGAAT